MIKGIRIGNYVETHDGIVMVEQIRELESNGNIGIYYKNGFSNITTLNFNPIAINEELLLKLGFENWGLKYPNAYETETQYVLHNAIDGTSDFRICLNNSNYGDSEYSEWIVKIDNDVVFIECNNIHTLQNIFYLFAKYDLKF